MIALEFRKLDIVFGDAKKSKEALALLDKGEERQSILEKTNCVLGAAQISFSVQRGEICVLMGLSGSGKSTLLRAVNRLNKISRGQVIVYDDDKPVDVASCDAKTLRYLRQKKISMVFQQFALLSWRTVKENISLGLELSDIPKEDRDNIIAEQLRLVCLEEWGDKYPHELSGGMQQRVGLARAFATNADILLMDEPFSALDPLIRVNLQDELLELQKSLNKTVLFVSHDLDESLKIGNHIGIMENGKLIQFGTPAEIITNPATEYVANFVAHINPLNVLTADQILSPLKEGALKERQIRFNDGNVRVLLGKKGEIAAATAYEKKLKIIQGKVNTNNIAKDGLIVVPHTFPMKKIIRLLSHSPYPVLVTRNKKIIGSINNREVYKSILR